MNVAATHNTCSCVETKVSKSLGRLVILLSFKFLKEAVAKFSLVMGKGAGCRLNEETSGFISQSCQ